MRFRDIHLKKIQQNVFKNSICNTDYKSEKHTLINTATPSRDWWFNKLMMIRTLYNIYFMNVLGQKYICLIIMQIVSIWNHVVG